MSEQSQVNIILLVVGLVGLSAIFYPMRKQATYFNQCVETGREHMENYKTRKTKSGRRFQQYWMSPVGRCNGGQN